MVSRVYQPVYNNRFITGNKPTATSQATQQAAAKTSQQSESTAIDAFESGQTSDTSRPDLATLRDQAAGRRIRLDSVLTDFESTLNALGVSVQTGEKLRPYLTVVRLQGQEARPNITLIKATLLTASKTLDGFIAKATGKPTDVVEQWMQSLMAQDIDFQSVSPPAESTTSTQPMQFASPLKVQQSDIIQWVKAAKTQPPATAIPLLQQALQAATDQPHTQGRLHTMLAKRYWSTGQTDQALDHLGQSLTLQSDPVQQAKQRVLLGNWHNQLNQSKQAVEVLTPLWSDNLIAQIDNKSQARAQLDYGTALIASSTPDATVAQQAIPHLVKGLQQAKGETGWIKAALPILASAYLTTGDHTRALRVLQRHSQLN